VTPCSPKGKFSSRALFGFNFSVLIKNCSLRSNSTRYLLFICLHRAGPAHGNVTVGGDSTMESFVWNDIEHCDVVYHHHHADSADRDEFFLRVSNSRRSIRTRVVVQILPGAAHPPRLKLNDPTEVRQYGYAQVTTIHLDQSMGHSSSDVVYTLTSRPRYGEVLIMYRPMTRGQPVDTFTQLDLDKGHVWYHHSGRDSALRDTFRFLLGLGTRPTTTTNATSSDELVHKIIVRPHSRDYPPRLVTSSSAASLSVRETDVQQIRRERFRSGFARKYSISDIYHDIYIS